MERFSLDLFKVFGIPVRANLSVGLLAAYLMLTFGNIRIGAFMAGVLILSILLHELAHSVVAMAFGGKVREISLQLLGGCAMITRMPAKPWQECLMAAAGPLCSILLAVLFGWLSMLFGAVREIFTAHGPVYLPEPHFWLFMIALLNFGLAMFNLIPAYPMDGGRILRSALQIAKFSKLRATEIAVRVGQGFAILWVVTSVLGFMGIVLPQPADLPILAEWLWDMVLGKGSILLLLIAYMIWVSGRRELAYVRAEADWFKGGWR